MQHTASSHASPCLEAALVYAAYGWRVLPLDGKVPRLPQWPARATTDVAAIEAWWSRWPTANVGMVTGAGSGLAVIDVDPRHGGDDRLRDLEKRYHPLPETPQVLSGGGGWHYYYATDTDLPCIDLAPGVNFLADGQHQVVAPPSLHASGRRYAWELSSHPDDVALAPLPDWIRALVADKAGRQQGGTAAPLPATLPRVDIARLDISPAMRTLIRTGSHPHTRYASRSEAVFAVICALVSGGHDDATIAAVLLDPHHAISAKPLSQKNPRSPRYWEQTRAWVAQEISRARAKQDADPGRKPRPVPALWRPLRPLPSRVRRIV